MLFLYSQQKSFGNISNNALQFVYFIRIILIYMESGNNWWSVSGYSHSFTKIYQAKVDQYFSSPKIADPTLRKGVQKPKN